MTANWTALHARVDEMTPAGNTNQTIGLQWAWQSLTQTDPLNTPAKDPNYEYKDIIILLTDGLLTENRWSQTSSSVDKRTQKACDNIRTAGITLYTSAGHGRQRDAAERLRDRHDEVLCAHQRGSS